MVMLFGKKETKQDSNAKTENRPIRLKKPDPDYRMKQDERLHKVLRETTEFGMDEIQIVIDQLKKRENHVFYRERVAYLAGEIGKKLGYGYPNYMAENLVQYLLCELDGRPESLGGVGKDSEPIRIPVSQPNVAALAALVALEKISTNDDIFVGGTLVDTEIIPGLKRLHKTTVPELRPCIRQTIMNIKAVWKFEYVVGRIEVV